MAILTSHLCSEIRNHTPFSHLSDIHTENTYDKSFNVHTKNTNNNFYDCHINCVRSTMTIFTTCSLQHYEYDLDGGPEVIPSRIFGLVSTLTELQDREEAIRLAVEQFLPEAHLTDKNLAHVRWHLASENCEEKSLRPLSDLMTGLVVPGPEEIVHLHAPETHATGQRRQSTPASVKSLSGIVEDNDEDKNSADEESDDDDNEDGQDGGQSDSPQHSTESMPADAQTNVMDEHQAGDQLYIKIIYDLKRAPEISRK